MLVPIKYNIKKEMAVIGKNQVKNGRKLRSKSKYLKCFSGNRSNMHQKINVLLYNFMSF